MTSSFTAHFNVAQALGHAQQQGLDRADREALLCALLSKGRAWLIGHDDSELTGPQQVQWLNWLHRRLAGEPVAYIVGEKEFFGLTLAVNPDVLVPRPDTETLVEWALELLHTLPAQPKVLDLGTGSGAIALALAHSRPDAQLTAVDASEAALRTAQANAQRHGLRLRMLHGSWFAPVAGERFDLIVSNPPYIAEADPHMPALHFEPRQALTSGPDGLDDIRTITTDAAAHLAPGGWLLFEHGWDQAEAVRGILQQQGFEAVAHRQDLAGHTRCTGGRTGSASRS